MEYYSAIKRNAFESALMRWMNLEPFIQSEKSQEEKDTYGVLMHIYQNCFIFSSVSGHLGCFYVLAVVNSGHVFWLSG